MEDGALHEERVQSAEYGVQSWWPSAEAGLSLFADSPRHD
jgi:hypothetical protein